MHCSADEKPGFALAKFWGRRHAPVKLKWFQCLLNGGGGGQWTFHWIADGVFKDAVNSLLSLHLRREEYPTSSFDWQSVECCRAYTVYLRLKKVIYIYRWTFFALVAEYIHILRSIVGKLRRLSLVLRFRQLPAVFVLFPVGSFSYRSP